MRIRDAARRYAKALMAVTKQNGSSHATLEQIAGVEQSLFADDSVMNFFANPTVTQAQKISTLEASLKGSNLSQDVSNLLLVLLKRERLTYLPEIVAAFRQSMDQEDNVTRGVVRSAEELSSDAKKDLEDKINKVLKKKIILTYEKDAKLLGGVIAQVGGWTFDASLDTQLKKMNEDLNRRAN